VLATIALNCAYVTLVVASLTRRMVSLRIWMLAASVFFIGFGIMQDIPSMILWNIAIGGSHAFFLARSMWASRQRLTGSEAALATRLFPQLSPADHHALWAAGVTEHHQQVHLTVEGMPTARTLLLTGGEVEVRQSGQWIETLQPGAIVGTSPAASGGVSFTDAITVGSVTVQTWTPESLDALAKKHPEAAQAFNDFVQRDIAAKLQAATRRISGPAAEHP